MTNKLGVNIYANARFKTAVRRSRFWSGKTWFYKDVFADEAKTDWEKI